MKTQFDIQPISDRISKDLQHKIDFKTKPLGALGQLESIALQIGQIQNTLSPKIEQPHILVFAADHGLANEGVSAYPQEVTHQMVLNFLGGGAAINIFCKQHDIQLKVVDAGVNHIFQAHPNLIDAKIGLGTRSSLNQSAMDMKDVYGCIEKGAMLVETQVSKDCKVIGFGEMGIGNTSSASLIMHYLTQQPIEICVGNGTGVNPEQYQHKVEVLKQTINHHGCLTDPYEILSAVGGFEISQMVGAYLKAAENGLTILVDGFITSAAFALAYKINSQVKSYAIFSHQSHEKGHELLLEYLGAESILNLGLRLGEGTGSALVLPLIRSAVYFLNEMASFEEANVSNKA